MVRVAPVKLQMGSKVLWFDPNDIDIKAGQKVVVSTERGNEFGVATTGIIEVTDELIEGLNSPLKPVLRIATERDINRAEELRGKSEEALPIFKQFAAETNEDMHPISVEYLLDGDKAVFYFEAEDRVDFRDLVRRLAAHFHVRVDMRQIGVRDGARLIGGLGHCGQELCCKRFGGEFSPVSIRMAKEQNLSLNPQKISGICGRLMCCLRYEYEAYKEVNARAPKIGAKVEIPDGFARVSEINVPLERVSLQLEDGKTVKIPLDEFESAGEGKRPNKVSKKVFEKYSNVNSLDAITSSSSVYEVSNFTGTEKLAEAKNTARRPKDEFEKPPSSSSRRSRRRRHSSGEKSTNTQEITKTSKGQLAKKEEKSGTLSKQKDKPKRRRSKSNSANSSQKGPQASSQGSSSKNAQTSSQSSSKASQSARRPGQKSSGLRNLGNSAARSDAPEKHSRVPKVNEGGSKQGNRQQRRHRKGPQNPKAATGNAEAPRTPRSNQDRNAVAPSAAKQSKTASEGNKSLNRESTHRKPRRRRHTAGGESHENG